MERNERGASAVEYGLLLTGIAVLCMVAVFTLGITTHDFYEDFVAIWNAAASLP